MTQRLAAKCLAAKQNNIDCQNDGSEAKAKTFFSRNRIGKPKRLPNIVAEQADESDRDEKKIAMDVLKDERERFFTQIGFAGLCNRTGGRVGPEGFIVRPAIIIAGETEPTGRPKDKKCRRKSRPFRPPVWLGSKPGMGRIAK